MVHEAIYRELIQIAREQGTTFYSEIDHLAGLDVVKNPRDRTTLGVILSQINSFEHACGRPLLSAVVVLKGKHVPSKGFFASARSLGQHLGRTDRQYWRSELVRVHDYWSIQ